MRLIYKYIDTSIIFITLLSIVILLICTKHSIMLLYSYISNWIYKFVNNNCKYSSILSEIKQYEKKNNCNMLIISDVSNSSISKKLYNFETSDSTRFQYNFNKKYNYKQRLDIVIHTKGGSIFPSDIMIKLLIDYKSRGGVINIYIPYYAYSAGTFLMLVGTHIYMNVISLVSPTDPQFEYEDESYSMDSLIRVPKSSIKNNTVFAIMQNDNIKYYNDNINIIREIQKKNKKIDILVDELASGKYPHNKPFSTKDLQNMGIRIHKEIPELVQKIGDMLIKDCF